MKENRFKTDLPEMMVGMYAAEDIRRHWTEDLTDDETGELVSVDRSELVLERGTLIDSDVASRLAFHLQAGDISRVAVTDVQRTARLYSTGNGFMPWKVAFAIGSKNETLILYAKTLDDASAIAKDYIERNRKGYFSLQTVASFKECIVIEREFTADEMVDADNNPIERAFYQLDTAAVWREGGYAECHIFIALARDVDEARAEVEEWIHGRAKKRMLQIAEEGNAESPEYKRLYGGFDLSVIAGTKIPCTATVPVEQSKDYYEALEEGKEKEA